ncbi:MAG TPA: ATP-binding cassette domain-containing protein [Gaiellaceae bacterium]|jgi:branched-chain amino acid transport system permease protein
MAETETRDLVKADARAAAVDREVGTLPRARSLPWRAPTLLAAVAVYLAFTYYVAHDGSLYLQGLILVAAVFGILAVSLDLVAGMVGLYSLGHAGLFAIGAYGTTLLYNDRHWNLFVLLPVSMLGVGLVGLLLGTLTLRVSGLYFAITTFIFTLVITVVASDFAFTGGYGGLIGPIFPGFPSWLDWLGQSLIWCCMALLGLVVLLSLALRRSPLYPILLAIRDAEPFAAAAGARTALLRIGLFGVSAAMAGAAGWVFTFQGFISPSQFDWTVSVNILVMVILGGLNTTIGPVLGAAFVTMFPAQVNINPFWQEVLFGGLFLAVIVVYPAGFVGLVEAVGRRLFGLLPQREREQLPAAAAAPPEHAAPVGVSTLVAAAREGAHHPEAVPAVANGETRAPSSRLAVECRGIRFAYGSGAAAVNDVDFLVKEGSIHGLIGPNGSGKTTLVNLIAGRLRPQAGTIRLEGVPFERGGPAARARAGFMRTFQAPVLVRELSVADNVGVGLYSRVPRVVPRALVWPTLPTARRDGRRVRARAADALRFVGAEQWTRTRITNVPHGIQQLTQLAAAVVAGPRAVILDEPLAGLSPTEVEHVATILGELKSAGVSVILIEHQPRFVFALCDEVTVLDAGEVVATGPAAEVRDNARVREVYLGR